ncbi:MAG TPA: phosphoribosylformylglycinamidine cyclo-ligase [Blastocatellia bacterium]|nr:phosphoribosylformylglycinamidine cyclo-ligase [Blastocatellia bacterium]HMV86506.1 phosphoribosylformylglycinamidine cyclo-ligase [Blastocatellia bacterium]HMX27003.1 phosphoribosylformylglycinamidine cyclo-ligase [Blastocatellia bacterium]HMY72320.1 phosphoribosylformylglycinamidine cyclo-ligase [Blastocatellia bacterium]HMZ21638.1 phosphoribosylformylglycinamidine cyclo-ligase [Blastocatellia bacterium]
MEKTITYKDAGVNIDAANQATARIKKLARSTFNENVMSEIGSFGGMFNGLFNDIREPVLVSSCDGVGTKLKAAFATGIHHTVGHDLVSHCVNDILVQGARPLFFLDYIATGKLDPAVIEKIIEGIATGCREAECALLGGETAEMPEMYQDGEYDIAGFIVGVVDRKKVINGSRITAGDVVVGLASAGLHTNGYSLARKLLLDVAGYQIDQHVPELGCTVGEELLKPHKSYLPALQRLIEHEGVVKGLAHITGGGLVENIPRILPRNVDVAIKEGSWPVLPVCDLMQRIGNVPREDMLRTFNLGIGMVVIVNPGFLQFVKDQFNNARQPHYVIGEVVDGSSKVRFV